MNKPTSKFISLLLGVGVMTSTLMLNSCKDDEKDNILPVVEIPTEFSTLTVEQNKAKLEDNGLELVTKMNTLKNTAGIKSSISFNHFLSAAELPENGRAVTSNKAVKMMLLLSKFGIGKAKASDVLKGFRSKEDEPETPQEVFDDLKGTYTFNASTDEWVYTATSDKIVFKFPSTEAGTTNNAEFSIYGYTSQQVTNDAAEYEGDVPTALKADLTVSGTKILEYNFTASYKANGEPTSVATSITLGTFKFAFNVINTTSEVAVNYALTESGTNLLSLGAGATGNFNSDNIGDDASAGDVVTSSSAYFQIMNIKFAGEVNVKTLDQALDTAETIQQEAAAYNASTTFVVFYADSKKKIADLEFYGTTVTEEGEYCWDSNGDGIEDGCETWTDTYDTIDVRLIFADDSKANLDTYTDVGFDELETELEEFVDSLEDDLG